MFRAACLKERTIKYLSARGRPTIAPSIINLSCVYKAEAFTYSSEDLPILIIKKKKIDKDKQYVYTYTIYFSIVFRCNKKKKKISRVFVCLYINM